MNDDKYDEILSSLDDLETCSDQINVAATADSQKRAEVVRRLKALARHLQTPIELAWDIFFQPHQLSVSLTALEAGWLHSIHNAGEQGVSADKIAESSQSDPSLIRRMLRYLASTGIVKEVERNTYAPALLCSLFCKAPLSAGLRHAGRDYAVPLSAMPQYFVDNGYQSPTPVERGIYRYATGTTFFEHLSQTPSAAEAFDTFMTAAKSNKKSWLEVFPVESLRVDSPKDILLVDVGGGRGHELAELAVKKDSLCLKGKLILQDREDVLKGVPNEWRSFFTAQSQDLFTPQGEATYNARAYYLRNILHGWPDEDCIVLLRHLRDAMKVSFSSLLINELVLLDKDCPPWSAAFDITMMAVVSGRERTMNDWNELIEQVGGLQIEKIWCLGSNGESLIEVRRVS